MKFFEEFAKFFFLFGLLFILIGGILFLFSKLGTFKSIPRLPLDIVIERKNFKFYFPLGTSILISIILTLLLNIILRFLSKK